MAWDKTREVLIEIHDSCGKLTPPIVVERARKKSSPLHELFEWNDGIAGHAYRLKQARDLIRRVHIIVVQNDVEVKRHVFFHTCDTNNEPVYYTKEILLSDNSLLIEAERQAMIKLGIALRTLTELQEISGLDKRKRKKYKVAEEYVDRAISAIQ